MRKNPLVGLIISVLIIVVGIGVVIWMYVSSRNYVEGKATVKSVVYDPTAVSTDDDEPEKDYLVTLEYTVDGKTYTTEVNANQSDYSVDEEVKIAYDPDKPEDSMVGGKMPLVAMIGICVAVFIVGGIGIIKSIR